MWRGTWRVLLVDEDRADKTTVHYIDLDQVPDRPDVCVMLASPVSLVSTSAFFHEFGFKLVAGPINFAVNFMVAGNNAYAANFGAFFQDRG